MRTKLLSKITLAILLIINAQYSQCLAVSNQDEKMNKKSEVYVNKSFYSLDKQLIKNGYSLGKDNENNLILFHENKVIGVDQFYSTSVGPNVAIKLFILLKNTCKDCEIYLNGNYLNKKTDTAGMAFVDVYEKNGNYQLELINRKNAYSLNYFFTLEYAIKLICTGINKLDCEKECYGNN